MMKCAFEYTQPDFVLNVDLQTDHEIVGIRGISGVGKTTLLKNIVGLLNPTHGSIELNDEFLYDSTQKINKPMYQRNVAFIFQKAHLFPHFNVIQNLQYARNIQKKKILNQVSNYFEFEKVVEVLALEDLLTRKSQQLSGGEAQRVAIGRALLSSPQLLLLDEPLSGLDVDLRTQTLDFLKKVNHEFELPMIYVTHHAEELEYLSAKTYTLINVDKKYRSLQKTES